LESSKIASILNESGATKAQWAWHGDSFLRHSVTQMLEPMHSTSPLQHVDQRRNIYVANQTMAAFLTLSTDIDSHLIACRLKDNGYCRQDHAYGTVFEALLSQYVKGHGDDKADEWIREVYWTCDWQ
jgi:dsRNA-specific ribonuclease